MEVILPTEPVETIVENKLYVVREAVSKET